MTMSIYEQDGFSVPEALHSDGFTDVFIVDGQQAVSSNGALPQECADGYRTIVMNIGGPATGSLFSR